MSNRAKIFSPFAALRGYEDEIASEGRDHLNGNRIELFEEGKQALNQKISQLRKGQELTIKYFTDGYYENIAGILDAVDAINKELRIYTGFINDTGKELPTIIAFDDISSPSLHPAHRSVRTDKTFRRCKSLPGYRPELWVSLLLHLLFFPVPKL